VSVGSILAEESRPFVNPRLAHLKAVLLGLFLAIEDNPSDASDFYD
jgi:hypothetical protein